MNSIKSLRYKKAGTTLLFALLTMACFAQNNVRLLNGSAFISESAASAADGRLATELPNHDVRISYVTSFVGVQDRYKVYEDNDLTAFSQLPNTGNGFAPATQEQKDAAVNAGMHLAVTTLPSPRGKTIHIIYAVSVSLDTEGNEVFSSRKLFRFGDEVDRRAKKIVEQIIPDPELLAAGEVGENDAYLADYVEELIAALNDPGYVVNGSIQYGEDIFFDGDTIYMDYQSSEAYLPDVTHNSPVRTLTFLHQNISQLNISWQDVLWNNQSDATTLLLTNGSYTRFRPKALHFTEFRKIIATAGLETTTVYVRPINLQVDLSSYLIETNAIIPIKIDVKNNHLAYAIQGSGSLMVKQSGTTNNYPVPKSGLPQVVWNRTNECNATNFTVEFVGPNQGVIAQHNFSVRIKCPKTISSYFAQSHFQGKEDNALRKTESSGDTLHVVRTNNEAVRKIEFIVDTDGDEDDYWDNGVSYDDPIWDSRENDLHSGLNGQEKLTQYYDDWTFISGNVYDDKVEVTAFEQNKEVFVALHNENRNTTTVNHPIKSMIESKIKPRLDKVTEFLQEYINEEFSAELILKSDGGVLKVRMAI